MPFHGEWYIILQLMGDTIKKVILKILRHFEKVKMLRLLLVNGMPFYGVILFCHFVIFVASFLVFFVMSSCG